MSKLVRGFSAIAALAVTVAVVGPTPFTLRAAAQTPAPQTPAARGPQQPPPPPLAALAPAKPADVDSVDAILDALYDVISGPKGAPRDWNRFRSLFFADSKLISVVVGQNGAASTLRVMTPDEFAARQTTSSQNNALFEHQMSHQDQRFGNIVHSWSPYELRRDPSDAKPFGRGVSSFELFYDGSRWWIVTLYWQAENPANPIPASMLGGK